MSRTVSFRCSEELNQFLEEEAERRMTTKSTVAQMIVAQFARDVSQDGETVNTPVDPPEKTVNDDQDTGPDAEPFDQEMDVHFDNKAAADAARKEFSEHLSDDDDKRLKRVRFVEGTPAEVVAELKRRVS
jgi:hypothetical protein